MKNSTALVKKSIQQEVAKELGEKEKLLSDFKNQTQPPEQTGSIFDKASTHLNKQLHILPKQTREKISIFEKTISTQTFVLSNFLLLIIGLLLIFGLYYYVHNGQIFPVNNSLLNYLPATKKPTSLVLELKSPDDNLLTFNGAITISGSTLPNTNLIISTNNQDFNLESDNKGQFSKIIDLDLGLNEIMVNAFDKEGNIKSEERIIFYSEEKL